MPPPVSERYGYRVIIIIAQGEKLYLTDSEPGRDGEVEDAPAVARVLTDRGMEGWRLHQYIPSPSSRWPVGTFLFERQLGPKHRTKEPNTRLV